MKLTRDSTCTNNDHRIRPAAAALVILGAAAIGFLFGVKAFHDWLVGVEVSELTDEDEE